MFKTSNYYNTVKLVPASQTCSIVSEMWHSVWLSSNRGLVRTICKALFINVSVVKCNHRRRSRRQVAKWLYIRLLSVSSTDSELGHSGSHVMRTYIIFSRTCWTECWQLARRLPGKHSHRFWHFYAFFVQVYKRQIAGVLKLWFG